MIILGIETSCDDTGASIVKEKSNGRIKILSNITSKQDVFHQRYSGVVPEIAARKHVEFILPVIEKAMTQAKVTWKDIDGIAVTTHPGLISSLFVGVGCAQTLAYLIDKPLVSVSHLKAHFFSVPLDTEISYPFIGLLVSGGHTLLARCDSPLEVEVLGTTLDDACGECFDKVAKHYGLGYPGGPAIERVARKGDPLAYNFPRPQFRKNHSDYNYHFSFSGLKTAVIHHSGKYLKKNEVFLPDLIASLQKHVVDTLWDITQRAANYLEMTQIGICGGVAANGYLREVVKTTSNYQVFFPQMSLCTDNAAMIAGLGCHYFREGEIVEGIDALTRLQPVAQAFKKNRIL